MAYLALARKWRPKTFSDLIGQEAVTKTLQNALLLNRVHHAILFTGTRGIGKTTSARILAKALNCEKGPTTEPCNECSNCIEIAAGASMDVLEIDGASNTSVDDVRDLRETVKYAPSKSKHKIYIIDEVHMLSNSAFNALLKTLEEPPSGVYFLFATTEVHKIPETILSRVQRFDLKELSTERIVDHLKKIAECEKIKIQDGSLLAIAQSGEGSMRDALSLFDQVITFTSSLDLEISSEEVAFVLGHTDTQLMQGVLEALAHRNVVTAMSLLHEVFQKGYDVRIFLTDLIKAVRDSLFIQSGLTIKDAPNGHYLSTVGSAELHRWFDLLRETVDHLGKSTVPRQYVELCFLKMTRPSAGTSLTSLIERLEQLESQLHQINFETPRRAESPRSIPAPTFRAAPPAHETMATPSNVSNSSTASITPKPSVAQVSKDSTEATNVAAPTPKIDLAAITEIIRKCKPPMLTVLEQSRSKILDQNTLILTFDSSQTFLINRAKDLNFSNTFTECLKENLGLAIKLVVKVQDAHLSSASTIPKPSSAKSIEREALEHPLVQKTMSLFQAKIEDIKPLKK